VTDRRHLFLRSSLKLRPRYFSRSNFDYCFGPIVKSYITSND
jgi:hypothetical protein